MDRGHSQRPWQHQSDLRKWQSSLPPAHWGKHRNFVPFVDRMTGVDKAMVDGNAEVGRNLPERRRGGNERMKCTRSGRSRRECKLQFRRAGELPCSGEEL